MDRSNEILGLLHGMYGLGGILSPIIATSMVTRGLEWYTFYYIMIGMAALAVIFSGTAFWGESALKYRQDHPKTQGAKSGGRTREAVGHKVTWIIALFLFIYVGAEGMSKFQILNILSGAG